MNILQVPVLFQYLYKFYLVTELSFSVEITAQLNGLICVCDINDKCTQCQFISFSMFIENGMHGLVVEPTNTQDIINDPQVVLVIFCSCILVKPRGMRFFCSF